MNKTKRFIGFAVVAGSLVWCGTGHAARRKPLPAVPPDLTRGGQPTDTPDYRLGPTGAQGWVWTVSTRAGASRDARQILITLVEPDSPAAGKLQLKDVIVGVKGKIFDRDARKVLADAINHAEQPESKGRLPLMVWRAGEVLEVPLVLEVMGRCSDTAPYHCEKTEAIIAKACAYLKDKPLKNNWEGHITALGLLAAGREDLMPMLTAYAHEICIPGEVLNVETHESMLCWRWAYKTLFLTEYYLITKDEQVLPTIREYATKIAMGQSGVGTWGHTVAARANTGQLHGHLGGYGAMNQTSMVLMMDLVLAEKCGITHEEITRALEKGEIFFDYYTGKGAIPYGDHKPAKAWFDDNGKCGSAAIMFDLLGNKPGAEFFSAMVLGSAPGGREEGHTGSFWSQLWGGLGAARSGPEGLSTFFQEMRWFQELERGWNGSMAYQGNAGERGKQGEPKTKWDSTGARLLQLCLPKKHLYITGKGMSIDNPLRGDELAAVVEAGRFLADPRGLGTLDRDQIMQLLSHRLPPVRHFGVRALVEQEISAVDDLLALLDSDQASARYGACEALSAAGFRSEQAVAALVAKIRESDDLMLRLSAIDALIGRDLQKGLAEVAEPAIPVLLELAVSRSPDDPRRLLQRKLAFALFYRGRALPYQGLVPLHGLEEVDRSLLIPAIKELLTVDDGRARSCIGSLYPQLTQGDLDALWGDIYRATRDISPSGIMFADGIRISGLKLMQQHRVKEGVDLSVKILSENRWGSGNRQKSVLPVLAAYGAGAREALPFLKEMEIKDRKLLDAAIKAIESGKDAPLKSIESYVGIRGGS